MSLQLRACIYAYIQRTGSVEVAYTYIPVLHPHRVHDQLYSSPHEWYRGPHIKSDDDEENKKIKGYVNK